MVVGLVVGLVVELLGAPRMIFVQVDVVDDPVVVITSWANKIGVPGVRADEVSGTRNA